jgi:indolepyruvate ferredoxin oxidoreductase beta subunit
VKPFDIYLCGVGGQGIGLLAEVLGAACRRAGHVVRGCDTHGLAQRHGTVASHLRLGESALAARVAPASAHLILALERLEALRAATLMLGPGGTLIYYDAVYQPIHVRMGRAAYPDREEVAEAVAARGGRVENVLVDGLADPRLANATLLGRLAALETVPRLSRPALAETLAGAVPAPLREANLAAFEAGARLLEI